MNKLLELHNIDKLLNDIVRNEKYSDYEKILHITTEIIYPLVDKIEKLEKENHDRYRAGYDRGYSDGMVLMG